MAEPSDFAINTFIQELKQSVIRRVENIPAGSLGGQVTLERQKLSCLLQANGLDYAGQVDSPSSSPEVWTVHL